MRLAVNKETAIGPVNRNEPLRPATGETEGNEKGRSLLFHQNEDAGLVCAQGLVG